MKKVVFILSFISFVFISSAQWTTNGNDAYNTNTGNVGIGTHIPEEKLTVQGGNIIARSSVNPSLMTGLVSGNSSTYTGLVFRKETVAHIGFKWDGSKLSLQNASAHSSNIDAWSTASIMTWDNSTGNVGIGTSQTGSFKLAVEGKIGAREVQVTLANPWPDYVFSTSYNRMNLVDLKAYIKANSHLPNIPSAEEVKKDGIALGEMNAKLLEKIEELTLYVIELKEELDQLKKSRN